MTDHDREAFDKWAIGYMETLGYGAKREGEINATRDNRWEPASASLWCIYSRRRLTVLTIATVFGLCKLL